MTRNRQRTVASSVTAGGIALAVVAGLGLGCGDRDTVRADPQPASPPAAVGSLRRPLSSCAAVPRPPRPLNRQSFDTWKTAVQATLQCLHKNSLPADQFEALLELVEQEQEVMQKALEEQLASTLGRLEQAREHFEVGLRDRLLGDGLEARGPTTVDLGRTRLALSELNKLIDRYQTRMKQAQSDYAALAKRVVAYRKTEGAVRSEMEQIAVRASAANNLASVAAEEGALVQLNKKEMSRSDTVRLDVLNLQRALEHHIAQFDRELALFRPFMDKHGIRVPDMAGQGAVDTLKNVVGYCDKRSSRFSAAFTRLLQGIQDRFTALVAQAMDEDSREHRKQAALLGAITAFHKRVLAPVKVMLGPWPKSPNMGLLYLSVRYRACLEVLRLDALCKTTSPRPAFMALGCDLAAQYRDMAYGETEPLVPAIVSGTSHALERAGVDQALIEAIRKHVAAGDLEAAVQQYDLAVDIADAKAGTP